jgi:uncharacterized protein (DUF924 family)
VGRENSAASQIIFELAFIALKEIMTDAELLYRFWFGEGSLDDAEYVGERMKTWFAKNEKFDAYMREEFSPWIGQVRGNWKESPRDFLSLVTLHDQVPRNSFRETSRAFAYDATARELTKEALRLGYDKTLHVIEAAFLLLPLEHSENPADQQLSVQKFAEVHARAPKNLSPVTASTLDYARKHAEIITRFGRFPHRNELLGRESTPEEKTFLAGPGSRF